MRLVRRASAETDPVVIARLRAQLRVSKATPNEAAFIIGTTRNNPAPANEWQLRLHLPALILNTPLLHRRPS
jgi:hypothetical protein